MEMHGPWTDWILATLIAMLAYFIRERDKQISDIATKLNLHLSDCAHVTPREKQLYEELMQTRFRNLEGKIDNCNRNVEQLSWDVGQHRHTSRAKDDSDDDKE